MLPGRDKNTPAAQRPGAGRVCGGQFGDLREGSAAMRGTDPEQAPPFQDTAVVPAQYLRRTLRTMPWTLQSLT